MKQQDGPCVCTHVAFTGDRREVDAHQQGEKGRNVVDYIRHVDVLGRVTSPDSWQLHVFHQHTQRAVL